MSKSVCESRCAKYNTLSIKLRNCKTKKKKILFAFKIGFRIHPSSHPSFDPQSFRRDDIYSRVRPLLRKCHGGSCKKYRPPWCVPDPYTVRNSRVSISSSKPLLFFINGLYIRLVRLFVLRVKEVYHKYYDQRCMKKLKLFNLCPFNLFLTYFYSGRIKIVSLMGLSSMRVTMYSAR